jgi:TRAP-type C4-dicarboxylate transport system substrate-binding protein
MGVSTVAIRMIVLAGVLAGTLLGGIGLGTAGAAEVELRFSHWLPAQHPLQPTGFEPWAKSIADASDGRIQITIFPAQQLGAAPDHYDMARDGIADITFVNPGYQAGRFPIIAHGEIPFQITNAKGGSKALDAWYRPYAAKEMGGVKFCMAFVHSPGTFHSKEKLARPEDVRGKNIRPAQATIARFVNMLGGASVQVPAPEAREALAKGAADAITFPWNSLYLFGIDSITKYHLDMPLYVTTFVLVMNKARYEGMSEADRKVIDDHCTSDWAEKMASGWADWEDAGRTKMMADPSHKIYEPTPADVEAWRSAAAPLLDAWKADVKARGYDADAIHEAFVKTMKADGAYYGE